jgi:hypothetical protein
METPETAYQSLFNLLGKNDTQNVFTPPRLIRRMLSQITFNPEHKVLVWYNVEFLIYLVKEFGLSPKNIYIYTNKEDKLILLKQGYNVVFEEIIDLDKINSYFNGMKFDLVIGNPPFSKNKKEPKKLWSLFVVKSFELCKESGKVALITPSSWISSTNYAHSFIKDKLIYVNLSNKTSEYFGNTGGTQKFIYFIANNTPTSNCVTEFDGDIFMDINPCQTEYPPVKSTSHLLYMIVKKLSESNLPVHNWVRYDKVNNESGVVVSMSKGNGYDVTYSQIDDMNVSRYKLVCDENYGINIANNLNLKLYRILRWVIRSGPALASNFKHLPIPSDNITNERLYEILSLTPEEIQYVEEYQ